MSEADKFRQKFLEDLRKSLKEKRRIRENTLESEALATKFVDIAKYTIATLATSLKPIFAENGQSIEVIRHDPNVSTDENFIEVLYYPESRLKAARGVNTAALRFEFDPKIGKVIAFRRDSYFPLPLKPIYTAELDESTAEKISGTTLDFAKQLAAK